jgi:hypothetical protein
MRPLHPAPDATFTASASVVGLAVALAPSPALLMHGVYTRQQTFELQTY